MSDHTKPKSGIYLLVFFAGLGSFTYGYVSVLAGSIIGLPSFLPYFHIDTSTPKGNSLLGAMNGLFYGGAMIGCWVVALLSDTYGRKRCVQIVATICIIAGAIQAGSVHIVMFLIGRFIAGSGVGMACSMVPIYTAEISPPDQRGRLVGTHGVCLVTGYSVASWVCFGSYYVSNSALQWRVPLALQCVAPLLLFFVALTLLPESPRWLISQGRYEEGYDVLRKLYSNSYNNMADTEASNIDQEFEAIKNQTSREKEEFPSTLSMFKARAIRLVLIRGFLLQFLAQSTGVLVIANYQIVLFRSLGVTGSIPILLVAVKTGIAAFFNVVNTHLLDRFGRKKIMLIGLVGCMISLSCYAGCVAEFIKTKDKGTSIAAVFFLFLFVVVYASFIDASVYVYVSEIFPTSARATGVGFATSAMFIANLIYNMSAPTAINTIGWKFFLVFILIQAVCIGPFWYFYPETKGLTLEEIAARMGAVANTSEKIRNEHAIDGVDQEARKEGFEDAASSSHVENSSEKQAH